jgi:hypothetical protein
MKYDDMKPPPGPPEEPERWQIPRWGILVIMAITGAVFSSLASRFLAGERFWSIASGIIFAFVIGLILAFIIRPPP